jgi:thiol-disulfide isomerase/thioredoxin
VKMSPVIGVVLLLCACGVRSAVIELDDNSFYGYAKDRDVLLVDFYAPWCGDCKNLEPDFQAAGASLGARSIDLAKVDCFGAGKGLCNSFGIKEWPTLKNFNRGKYTGDYTGGLTAGEIAGYVNTVENAANPQAVSNPYAAPFQPMALATQQCVSRCKISKITNKAPCYAKCRTPKPAARKMLPQPVINEKSCAKCRQPQIAGKFSKCSFLFVFIIIATWI